MNRKEEAIKLLLIFDSIPPIPFYLAQTLFNTKTRQSTKASPCHSLLRNTRRWRSKQDSSHLHSKDIPVFNSREEFSTYDSQLNALHEAQLLLRASAVSPPRETQPQQQPRLCGDPNKQQRWGLWPNHTLLHWRRTLTMGHVGMKLHNVQMATPFTGNFSLFNTCQAISHHFIWYTNVSNISEVNSDIWSVTKLFLLYAYISQFHTSIIRAVLETTKHCTREQILALTESGVHCWSIWWLRDKSHALLWVGHPPQQRTWEIQRGGMGTEEPIQPF